MNKAKTFKSANSGFVNIFAIKELFGLLCLTYFVISFMIP